MIEPKIKTSLQLTARQLTALEAEAKRLGGSWGEVVRRMLDAWIDGPEYRAANPSKLVYDHPGSHPKG